uniref:G elongation factor, mitochondrial 2 n=1 Tax=Sinocyclocheilus anshuiensis TaxID=1608454 RepID=A0A671LKM8_9TELE
SLRAVINPDISKIRNIGIMAHIDAGKTTTTERMLYYSGYTRALGGEAQTMTVWRQAEKHKTPCVCFLNKMDKPAASLSYSIDSIKTKLKANAVLLQSFTGLVDLITRRKMTWQGSSITYDGCTFETSTLQPTDDPDVLQAVSEVADLNDDFAKLLLGQYSENFDAVPAGELQEAVRRVTLARKGVPVLSGSSLKNKGVQPLLDAITAYLPAPSERNHPMICVKVVHDKQRGPLVFVRIYSGSMKAQSAAFVHTPEPCETLFFFLWMGAFYLTSFGLKRYHNIETHLGPLQVAYRETILQSATATDTLDRTLGDKRHVVTVELAVHALMKESSTSCDVTFEEEGNTRLPAVVKEAVENGVQSAYLQGPVLGFPVQGVKTVIQHVSLEPGTSAAMVSTCSEAGWGAGFGAGDGSGSDCRGRVSESCACRSRPATRYCMRHPKSTGKQGYSTVLRTLTSGNATFSLELSSYEPMNTQDQNILLNKMAGLA